MRLIGLILAVAGLASATPAAAKVDRCTAQLKAGGATLTVDRDLDRAMTPGAAAPVTGYPAGIGYSVMARLGSGKLGFATIGWAADAAVPRGQLVIAYTEAGLAKKLPAGDYSFRMTGLRATREMTATLSGSGRDRREVKTRFDWPDLDAAFGGEDAVELTIVARTAKDKAGPRQIFVARARLDGVRRLIAAAPALSRELDRLAADPATNCYEHILTISVTHRYDCARFWENGEGRFWVDDEHLGWDRKFDGVQIGFNYRFAGIVDHDSPHRDPGRWLTFAEIDQPQIAVHFDDVARTMSPPLGSANSYDSKTNAYRAIEFGSIKVGKLEVRDRLPVNVWFWMPWSKWHQLMQQDGDILISAYNEQTGGAVRRTAPHDTIDKAIAALFAGYDAMLADERDAPARCKYSRDRFDIADQQDIIIT